MSLSVKPLVQTGQVSLGVLNALTFQDIAAQYHLTGFPSFGLFVTLTL
jgi:hypothetical protein